MGKSIGKDHKIAREIKNIDSKPSRWIASDVIRKLGSKAIQKRFKKSFKG